MWFTHPEFGLNIQFREDWAKGRVKVLAGGVQVYSHSEYRGAAEWAQKMYRLSDSELMDIYRDYKDDYDAA